MSAPLLAATDARVAIDGVVALAGISCETRGSRAVLVGHAQPLMSALMNLPHDLASAAALTDDDDAPPYTGFAAIVSGTLALSGFDVRTRQHLAHVGVAPHDAPSPPRWTVSEHVEHWAQVGLAHRGDKSGKREATAAAGETIERVGLTHAKRKAFAALSLPERRVLWIASAMASRPAVLIVDRPLSGLEGQAAAYVSGALAAAEEGRASIVSITGLAPGTAEGAVARRASDVLLFAGDALVGSGSPDAVLGDKRLYRVMVRSNGQALADLLIQRGASVTGGPSHYAVGLAEGEGPSDVLRAAHEVRSAVVEILPLM